MGEYEAISAVKQGHDVNNNIMLLWARHDGLINKACNKYRGLAEPDDLRQESFLILYNAVNNYDQDKGAKFSTYFYNSLSNGLHRYVTENGAIKVPDYVATTAGRVNNYIKAFKAEYNEAPNDAAIRAYIKYRLNRNPESVGDIKAATAANNIISMYTPITEDLTILDTIQDTAETMEQAERRADRESMCKTLYNIIDGLNNEQKRILGLIYGAGLTVAQISQITGIKPSRIGSIKATCFNKIKHNKHTYKLKEYSEIYLNASDVYNVSVRQFNTTWTSATEAEALRRVNE